MKIVLENKDISTDTFYIPPFVLYEGEIVVLYLYNGKHIYDTEVFLRNIFCGNTKHENVTVYENMTFVDYFRDSDFRDTFFPSKVNRYIKKDADLTDPFLSKLFEDEYVTRKTRINKLGGTQRKLLSLHTFFSKSKNVIFDVAGLDPQGCELTYKAVEKAVKNNGSAILLTAFDGAREYASKLISLEWKDGNLPQEEKFEFKF